MSLYTHNKHLEVQVKKSEKRKITKNLQRLSMKMS